MEPIPVPELLPDVMILGFLLIVMNLSFFLIMYAHFLCHRYTEKKKNLIILASNLPDELQKETDAIHKATEEYRKVIDVSQELIERLRKATEEHLTAIDVSLEVDKGLRKAAEELRRARAQTVGVGHLQVGIRARVLEI